MADLPYMKFFTGDWIRDTRFLSVETKGAWIDTLAALWDSRTRGLLSHPDSGWARLWGCSESQASQIITELNEVAEVIHVDNHTLIACRRIVREEMDREKDRNKKRKEREKKEDWAYRDYVAMRVPILSPDCPDLVTDNPPPIPESRVQSPDTNEAAASSVREEAAAEACPPTEIIEKIAQAYPKQSFHRETREQINNAIQRLMQRNKLSADEAGELILSGTKAISEKLAEWPSGERNQFAPNPQNFFQGDRWADDPSSFDRKKPIDDSLPLEPLKMGGRQARNTTDLREKS